MCQRVLISRNIASISTRSLERNLEAAAGADISSAKLARLNSSMDALYEIIYDQFNDIDKNDYKIIGPQLHILLKTVKDLYTTIKKRVLLKDSLKKEVAQLWSNYSALYEINDDLVKYRLNDTKDSSLSAALHQASSMIDLL